MGSVGVGLPGRLVFEIFKPFGFPQSVICFGCTSNCCANSATVFSPLDRRKRDFRLECRVWLRRCRLLNLILLLRLSRHFQAENPLKLPSNFPEPPFLDNGTGQSNKFTRPNMNLI